MKEIPDPFNVFVLHQNRAKHTQNNYVEEGLIPDFVNLVIWGHEHECLIMPEKSVSNPNVHISQPGKLYILSTSYLRHLITNIHPPQEVQWQHR